MNINNLLEIKNIISAAYKKHNFIFTKNKDTLYTEVIIDNEAIITLLPDDTIDDIWRNIDNKINTKPLGSKCLICDEIILYNVSCNKCSQNYCGKCYINIFKLNKGIIKCPYCGYSFGIKIPNYMMDIYINNIRKKMNYIY